LDLEDLDGIQFQHLEGLEGAFNVLGLGKLEMNPILGLERLGRHHSLGLGRIKRHHFLIFGFSSLGRHHLLDFLNLEDLESKIWMISEPFKSQKLMPSMSQKISSKPEPAKSKHWIPSMPELSQSKIGFLPSLRR
jgi:hypothetical protein